MYELSRVRLYSIGPAGARYADTVLDLRGVGEPVPDPAPTQAEFFEEEPVGPPRRPAPAGVLFLENGGGKSVLLKLIFSVMLPGHRNTLGGASSGVLRKFLLADDCGHVALEWQHTVTGETVVVGKAMAFLVDSGFLQRTGDDHGGTYRTTARYQLQVRDMAGSAAMAELLDLGVVPVTDGTPTLLPPEDTDDLELAADAGLPFHASSHS